MVGPRVHCEVCVIEILGDCIPVKLELQRGELNELARRKLGARRTIAIAQHHRRTGGCLAISPEGPSELRSRPDDGNRGRSEVCIIPRTVKPENLSSRRIREPSRVTEK